jgi:ADP-ribose pyrophosphatase YjhB (NUDIX family)
MQPIDQFRHCPRCGSPTTPGANPLACGACHFTFFFNPTVSAAAFVFDAAGRALFIRRAKEPARGKLAVPGGFIDIGETAEAALRREVHEEVNLAIDRIAFLCSLPNLYPYQGVTYPVCDLVFTAAAVDPAAAAALDGVAGFEWRPVTGVDPGEIAFPSIRKGLEMLMSDASTMRR